MKQVRFCFSQPIFILQEYIQFKETGFLRVKFDSSVIFIAGQIRLVMPDIKQHALLSVDYKIKYLNSKEDVIAKDHQYITANYTIKHHYADQFDGNVPLKNRWNRWNRKNRWKNRWNDRRGQVKHILKCFHSSDIESHQDPPVAEEQLRDKSIEDCSRKRLLEAHYYYYSNLDICPDRKLEIQKTKPTIGQISRHNHSHTWSNTRSIQHTFEKCIYQHSQWYVTNIEMSSSPKSYIDQIFSRLTESIFCIQFTVTFWRRQATSLLEAECYTTNVVLPVLMYGSETWEITDILVEQISKCQHIMERWILGCEVGVIEIPNSWVKTAHRILTVIGWRELLIERTGDLERRHLLSSGAGDDESGDLIKNPEISEKSGEMVGLILRVSLAVFEMLQDLFSQDVSNYTSIGHCSSWVTDHISNVLSSIPSIISPSQYKTHHTWTHRRFSKNFKSKAKKKKNVVFPVTRPTV
ncbi:hypothetical protein GQR58_023428 [Nymphon striatum]|nr:hypothetical protein GQR58_023428 [Nymphon striatum]